MNKRAFTLVELMIVMVIISLLASVAIPKFGDLIKSARQATAKHNLGVLKSATSIYYASNKFWPYEYEGTITKDSPKGVVKDGLGSPDNNAWVPYYLNEIPTFRALTDSPVENSNDIIVAIQGDGTGIYSYDLRKTNEGDKVAWVFVRDKGSWYINCDNTDVQGKGIHLW